MRANHRGWTKSFILLLLCAVMPAATVVPVRAASDEAFIIAGPWGPKGEDLGRTAYILMRIGCTESLAAVDYEGRIVPELAESWQVAEDGVTWTFTLRRGVMFHNGEPLTADLVAEHYRRIRKGKSPLAKAPIASIEARDARTLVIKTQSPFAPLPAYLAHYDSGILHPASFNGEGKVTRPIGTGPFRYTGRKGNQELYFERSEGWWGKPRPVLNKVVYRKIPDGQTRALLAESGQVNMARILGPAAIESIEASGRMKVYIEDIARTRLLVMNLTKPPFDDARVRRAINYAIDREALVRYVLGGVGRPAVGLFPPSFIWAPKDIQGYPYDPEKARALLAEAGWKQKDADGVLMKDGKRFEVEYLAYASRPMLPPLSEAIQAQLGKLGIKVHIKVGEPAAIPQAYRADTLQMAIVGRGLYFVPDPDFNLSADYHSAAHSAWNSKGYANPRVDALLEKGRSTFDEAERVRLYREAQRLILADSPAIWLNHYVNIIAVDKRYRGYRPHPSENRYNLQNIVPVK